MKVILSTGIGRLYLAQSAFYLKKAGVNICVITGWIPKHPDGFFVKIASKITGHKNLAAGLKKRQLSDDLVTITCAFPEFFCQFLLFLSKYKLIGRKKAVVAGWSFLGWYTGFFMNKYDIAHIRSCAGSCAIKKVKRRGAKVVVDHSIAHPAYFDRHLAPEYAKHGKTCFMSTTNKFWRMAIQDCHDADIVLVNSDFVKETFVDAGFDTEKIKVVYTGVRKDFFSLKKDYLITGKMKILFTGGFGFRKGGEYILKAMQELDKLGFQYELTIVGAYNEAVGILEKYPVKNIVLKGHVPQDDLKDYLSHADVYLFPSLCEGCASSLMEAMAAGLPVIATRQSGAPIIHKENGCLIQEASSSAIIDAVTELCQDSELREKIGLNAAKTIANDYTWEKYAEQVRDIYSKLLI